MLDKTDNAPAWLEDALALHRHPDRPEGLVHYVASARRAPGGVPDLDSEANERALRMDVERLLGNIRVARPLLICNAHEAALAWLDLSYVDVWTHPIAQSLEREDVARWEAEQ